ncbi:hypothetical protein GH714_029321 [Hevea brasiliensis]|uniref:Uncharacterized protein n=1 Tax=Hevea brasiliensis TaxID=3981 RepID=A0A6A6LNF7_HEVBR|nr:hypothetical protein GH714_029321 [Hevea brasiliensis]
MVKGVVLLNIQLLKKMIWPSEFCTINILYVGGKHLCAVEYSLLVGLLNKQAAEMDVEESFSSFGHVQHVYLMPYEVKIGSSALELRNCNHLLLKETEFQIRRRQRKKMCFFEYCNHLLLKENEFEMRRRQRKKIKALLQLFVCPMTLQVAGSSVIAANDIPEVAASLMPLCEAFGSLVPTSSNKSSSGDDPSIYMVFSNAFLFLLRLWKFYRPPLDQWLSEGGAFGGGLTLEYLLLLRNSRIASYNSAASNEINNDSVQFQPTSDKHVYIDFYPKLRAWYCQNKSCVASTVSGLSTGNPVHQVANKILNMIYSKMTKTVSSSGNSSTLSSNSLSGSASSSGEDPCQRPMLPAWEVLEAILCA